MKEIGGYIGYETYHGEEYHSSCIKLNTGRNCLRYLIRKKYIRKIFLPKYNCSAIINVCKEENVDVFFYEVDKHFKPVLPKVVLMDEYIYVINYYGQLESRYLKDLVKKYKNIIIDNAQAFFVRPISGIDTIYTCRKFFGVPDGAYLYSDVAYENILKSDMSNRRFTHLLGRYECTAEKFYMEYQKNENCLEKLDIQEMSQLTKNLMRSFDYKRIRKTRERNFAVLMSGLEKENDLHVKIVKGPYMYPLLVNNGDILREKLQKEKVFVPVLWPNVLEASCLNETSYYLTKNILPLPCDQRYTEEDMRYIIRLIKSKI